jgi:hypothetical protein
MIGVAMMLAAAALSALLFAPWYLSADIPGDSLSGIGGAGELWTVLLLATTIAGCGLLVTIGRGIRAASLASIAAAVLSLALCFVAAKFLPAHVVLEQLGPLRDVDLPRETAPIRLAPGPYLAMTSAALAGLFAAVALSRAPPPGMPGR